MGENKKEKVNAQQRILEILQRLLHGEQLHLQNIADEYGTHPETIKSDFTYIRRLYDDIPDFLVYDRREKVYRLSDVRGQLTSGDVLVLLTILYGSRSLNREECKLMKNKLLSLFSQQEQHKLRSFFKSFDYHYAPNYNELLLEKIQFIFRSILEQHLLKISYLKNDECQVRIVEPYTITFHNGAYYMVAYIHGKGYSNPAHYRLDKIKEIKALKEKFQIDHGDNRFQPGDYINQSYYMFTGDPVTVRLKIQSWMEEYLHRTFPKVKHISSDEKWITTEVEVLGTEGIIYWILSQQDRVEVLTPQSLRKQIIETLERMRQQYREDGEERL
jgi:predicted DNA-binding transcriptional regulator YafY